MFKKGDKVTHSDYGNGEIWKVNPKEESKQETIEEREPYWDLVDKKAEQNNTIDLDAYAKGVQDGAKWQQERMYSEEDMTEYAIYIVFNNLITPKQWLEQFKNKQNCLQIK